MITNADLFAVIIALVASCSVMVYAVKLHANLTRENLELRRVNRRLLAQLENMAGL